MLPTRADFLWAASKGQKAGGPHLLIQGVPRRGKALERYQGRVRVGFTASKKVGNAVARARAKRRMRELARAYLTAQATLDRHDYVFIARDSLCHAPWADLCEQCQEHLARVNRRLKKAESKGTDKGKGDA